jgi:predicted outer membrane repeat protein
MIINNQGFFGGGIFLNGNSVLNLKSTRVQLNTAESGGGIYCSGSGQLHILNDSGVINNTAIDGGGVFASDCDVKLAAGGAHNNAGALKGISINFAENSGGGVYLDNSVLSIVQDAINGHIGPSNIDNNRANVDGDDMGDGGGIFAQDSIIYASFGYFYQNRVINGHGGAILLDNSNLISQDSSWCLYSSDKCTWFEGNFIEHNGPGEFHGGAIFAFNNSLIGSEPYPLKGYFVDNSADQGSGIALSFQSVAEIQGSYFVENGEYGFAEGDDLSVIHVDSANSEANIRFSTFANNNNMAVFNSHNSGKINLRNSIVYESNDSSLVYLNSGGLFEYLCNVFHDSNGFGFIWEGSESVFTTDPGFVDPENGDYHIKFDSVAVDKCNVENLQQTIRLDRDGDSRLIDLPDVSNGTGPQDAGADEYNDVIFRNGFEPGASSAG